MASYGIKDVEDQLKDLNDYFSLSTQTPFDALKTAELDVQFAIDPSFGLNKQRFGWYSNRNFLDATNITEDGGKLVLTTTATGTDSVRLRSAYPGQYIAHTVSEPGVGARIPSEHLEYDSEGNVSLTHGEISIDIAQWSDTDQRALNSHGVSYEGDATYHQVRSGDQNVEFVKQENWNIDTLDGSDIEGRNPSGVHLRPEDGFVHLFYYTWYGEGAYILAFGDPNTQRVLPAHRYVPSEGNPPVEAPNMPVQVTVENQGTADPLECRVGGMQYVTHGARKKGVGVGTRSLEETRLPPSGYISTEVVTSNEAVKPFQEPGVPLMAIRRRLGDLRFEKGLRLEVTELFANVKSDIFVFIFDEYDGENANIDGTFTQPSGAGTDDTGLETNTNLTTYTPSNAEIRGVTFISSSKNSTTTITGDSSSRVPLQSTSVITAALAPGSNNTTTAPFIANIVEGF